MTGENPSGLSFQLHSPFGSADVSTRVHGRFNAFNVAAAMMAVCGLGFGFKDVAAAACYLQAVDGRMQAVGGVRMCEWLSITRIPLTLLRAHCLH